VPGATLGLGHICKKIIKPRLDIVDKGDVVFLILFYAPIDLLFNSRLVSVDKAAQGLDPHKR